MLVLVNARCVPEGVLEKQRASRVSPSGHLPAEAAGEKAVEDCGMCPSVVFEVRFPATIC